MSTTVTIDCSSLSVSDIVIDGSTGTYVLMLDGLGRPAITWRLTSMPDSADVHGTEYVTAAKEQSSLPLKVKVTAGSAAALDAAVVALEDALDQFTYTVTQVVDGVTKVWSAGPASYGSESGNVDSVALAQFYEVMVITIPVYPIAS